jgi:hypothetical protein
MSWIKPRSLTLHTLLVVLSLSGLAAQTPQGLTQDLQWRNIGPANMAGRVTDIEAVVANPARVIVGSASGGAFLSDNAGTTWEPIFED